MSWPMVTLNQICSTQYGYTASAEHRPVGPKFLRITDITKPSIDWDSVPHCKIDYPQLEKYRLHYGDIVIARTGYPGHAKLIRNEINSIFASYLVRITLDKSVADPQYVGRLLESNLYRRFVNSVKTGVAQANANARMLTLFRFPLPPLEYQSVVASILSAYDDLIENNRQRIKLLEKAARLIYEEWFVNFRFPGHENTKIVDGMPTGWEMKKLGDIVSIVKGKNITKDLAKDGEIPVVAGGLSPAYYHDVANVAGPVITVSGSGANAGYVNLYHEDIWASDCSYINSEVTEFFHYFYLLLTSRQKEIFNFQCGTAQPHVYPRDLKRLPVCTPTDNIILLFEESVSDYFMQMKILTRQNKILTKARDLLLPKLMKGEIDISGCL